MSSELVARFERRFQGGATVQADLCRPATGYSITVLFGPSGCGKTTTLRCLAGLERPQLGVIRFAKETWFDAQHKTFRTPQQRDIGYLFQDYALFPHLTVQQNIEFGLMGLGFAPRKQKVAEMLDRFGLAGLEGRHPRQLSGGQQQRAALARVLARRPRLLLLDEPLSALDASLREELRGELRRLLADFNIPVVLVTHDRTEAIALADEVVVMDHGTVRQRGPIHEVFTRPLDLSVARIVGVETVLPGHIMSVHEGLATVDVHGARLLAVAPDHASHDVYVCIRAEDVVLQKGLGDHTSVRNRLVARIERLSFEGALVRVSLHCGFPLSALVTRPAREELALEVGDNVTILLKAPSIHLIPRG